MSRFMAYLTIPLRSLRQSSQASSRTPPGASRPVTMSSVVFVDAMPPRMGGHPPQVGDGGPTNALQEPSGGYGNGQR
jgi:hypothetical protein